ncbi:hypothetical protein [Enterococcus faecalis]|uniref:hypothetical protein n=1 Tax=Enterococcus faecalis TaxID=1351 RepID=UPI0028C3833E|nr:hypothetical protein [Enterococcus faecalis]
MGGLLARKPAVLFALSEEHDPLGIAFLDMNLDEEEEEEEEEEAVIVLGKWFDDDDDGADDLWL